MPMMMGNKETVPVIFPEMLKAAKEEKSAMEGANPDATFEELADEMIGAFSSKNKKKLARALKAFIKLLEESEEEDEESSEYELES